MANVAHSTEVSFETVCKRFSLFTILLFLLLLMTLIPDGSPFSRDLYQISALEIQSIYSQYIRTKFPPTEPLPQEIPPPTQMKTIDCYTRIIQKAWRSYCNLRVYRYLRDIILNKLQGIPADLLRSIIPMETDFLDRAAGIHVRFRLGGAMFPPKIFYKIYTHRPLCDINAFAPRNYSIERRHQSDPSTLHNKSPSLSSTYPAGNGSTGAGAGAGVTNSSFIRRIQSSIRVGRAFYDATITPPLAEGMDDWYHREEDRNNPWRVISTELEDVFDSPPPWVLLDRQENQRMQRKNFEQELKRKKKSDLTSSPTSAYHFSRLRRQQDILLERKRRKREWMLKAYTLTAGSKGMVGGNEQPMVQDQHNTDGDGGGRSVGSDVELKQSGDPPRNTNAVIEMCDSYSSRSELAEHRQTQGRLSSLSLPSPHLTFSASHPVDFSQFDPNTLLAGENEISNGLQFRYSESKPHLKEISLPLVDPHHDMSTGTDDALLKWRYDSLPPPLSPLWSSSSLSSAAWRWTMKSTARAGCPWRLLCPARLPTDWSTSPN
jgi:hypothetical protein